MTRVTVTYVIKDILLTILTLGIWNLYVQYRQIQDVNDLSNNVEEFSFIKMFLLSIITFGIYFWWHEYSLTKRLHELAYGESQEHIEISSGILAFFGLWFIVDSYQQMLINTIVEKRTT